mmetsp:Transcript_511/g.825  ORF Transcript_511/g.825 Transcript_511/m.825 type:complete len:298 (-) Transcript_511:230-1123(-)|eukprot:CAMPEP_0184860088 /NCGR_PEP_ID=MMETSP0580-20130426/5040_1 /TAXON_ID=1118495 /ORGANISM="Dactyliosolen fragilissimus" /LENGTH=297 /DNA_ID=CAMNT_0027357059 /DNA_START=181 /DNA_END=1074 /DNA_ORIENTATION=+
MSIYKDTKDVPNEVLKGLDLIIVLGGGVPLSPDNPPIYTKNRCKYAAEIYHRSRKIGSSNHAKILAISAGTAHMPQLLSADGLPVWESTSSASFLMKELQVNKKDMYVETTSYDTISNAFFTRTNFCDIANWTNILIVTNEFHMERSKLIFDWIMNAPPSYHKYKLHYLSVPDIGLSNEALEVRYDKERKSADNISNVLMKNYPTLPDVFNFLNEKHSFYTASALVERANKKLNSSDIMSMKNLRQSYGGMGAEDGLGSAPINGGDPSNFVFGTIFGLCLFTFLQFLTKIRRKTHST